ncbi:MAG: hypothetical protein ACYTDY_08775 [Planctomycetota bacterium]
MLIPLAYSLVSLVFAEGAADGQPLLEMPDAKYAKCVRDTTYMRYHHWELLRAIREEVVRYGRRGEVGLHNCKECHTSKAKFCNRCHFAVSLNPDCFECHYYPD